MASISSVSSNKSSAWATMAAERKTKLFAKTDTDSSGGVGSTELQTLMDKVSERTGVTNTSTAADLMPKLDTNGNGTLDATELQKGIANIVPLPSTMDFAQTRSAGGGDAFASLDMNGDGKLSKTEFDAGKPHGAGDAPRGVPPPPAAAAGATSSDSTVYDPLDTNKDDIVSAAEAATGAASTDRIDINQLAQQVLKQYADIAAGQSSQTTGSTASVSA